MRSDGELVLRVHEERHVEIAACLPENVERRIVHRLARDTRSDLRAPEAKLFDRALQFRDGIFR